MKTLRILNSLNHRFTPTYKRSFSQCGEDLIASYLLHCVLGIEKPSYLDIGAHHPIDLNNTYLFYRETCQGVCVEPDPTLFQIIQKVRKRDECLNIGISGTDSEFSEFYVFNPKILSTFSKAECDLLVAAGHKLEQILNVQLVPINEIMERYFCPWPNFISLDTEGLEIKILESLRFDKFRSEVFCIETVEHTSEKKIPEISKLMLSNGYRVYADTFINTIYVEESVWNHRKCLQ